MDDGLDEVAANQRAITLLQRIQEDDPDLWQTVTGLPDGIRSALSARIEQPTPSNESYAQNVLRIEGIAGAAHDACNDGVCSLAV